ncbi:MAG: bifunctional hydroxymethylpyrimidine kinase/phosphomethylpyrimidine kinase [Acidobacteria bacterium]|nr:bifunctional hydroxymethylpyrimidine kinase/phosphomethylpyrimidine kinase [Acidobacteriota bacterium]
MRANRHSKNKSSKPKIALTIAGSDSGGCAGIQADLRTFRNLGVHGTCAITCVTAQNTVGVQDIVFLPPRIVEAQIRSTVADLGCDAAKTGMLGNQSLVRAVARAVRQFTIRNLVIDPVMVSTSGATLLRPEAIHDLRDRLIPLGTLVTPNLWEAELLSGKSVRTIEAMKAAAAFVFDHSGCPVLVKGGHLSGRPVDIFYDGASFSRFSTPRVHTGHTHGSGCTLAAAITAFLARGMALQDAIAGAKDYVHRALKNAYPVGEGPGPLGDPEELRPDITSRREE